MKKSNRIPELDGFRVLLVFIVSWYHIWQQSWWTPYIGHTSLDFLVRSGYIHVDGTILLSGFLLFLPYARAMKDGTRLPDTADFYRRRVCRVVPSFYTVVFAAFFIIALPFGLYSRVQSVIQDLFMHLTFTFNLNQFTYIQTPLGAAYWTIALEMQMYLLFPWIARRAVRRPAAVLSLMALTAWAWRGWCIWSLTDYSMVVNQLPAFLDVYALGMLLAVAYTHMADSEPDRKQRIIRTAAATAVLCVCLYLIVVMLKRQAGCGNYPAIQEGQMIRRMPMALAYGGIILSLPWAVKPIRWLMGNRVMHFLAGISMNYYLIHQTLCVHLRRLGIPYSVSDTPNYVGEMPWRWQYTFLSFGLSVLAAVLVTYLVEKPAAKLLTRLFSKRVCGIPVTELEKLAAGLQEGDRVELLGTDVPSALMVRTAQILTSAGCTVHTVMKDTAAEKACGNDAGSPGLTVIRNGKNSDAPPYSQLQLTNTGRIKKLLCRG